MRVIAVSPSLSLPSLRAVVPCVDVWRESGDPPLQSCGSCVPEAAPVCLPRGERPHLHQVRLHLYTIPESLSAPAAGSRVQEERQPQCQVRFPELPRFPWGINSQYSISQQPPFSTSTAAPRLICGGLVSS